MCMSMLQRRFDYPQPVGTTSQNLKPSRCPQTPEGLHDSTLTGILEALHL